MNRITVEFPNTILVRTKLGQSVDRLTSLVQFSLHRFSWNFDEMSTRHRIDLQNTTGHDSDLMNAPPRFEDATCVKTLI
jgi:hypothetical protein